MYLKTIYISIFYKLFIVVLCVCGIILYHKSFTGPYSHVLGLYFSIQITLIIIIYYIFAISKLLQQAGKGGSYLPPYPRLKATIVFCGLLMLLIYNFILLPNYAETQETRTIYNPVASTILHDIIPLLIVAEWLVLDPKGKIHRADPLLWLLVPYTYMLFTALNGRFFEPLFPNQTHYPYHFINIQLYGSGPVITYTGELSFIFLLFGYLLFYTDYFLGRKNRQ